MRLTPLFFQGIVSLLAAACSASEPTSGGPSAARAENAGAGPFEAPVSPACPDGGAECVCPTDDDACRNRKIDALVAELTAARPKWPAPRSYAFSYEQGGDALAFEARIRVQDGVALGPRSELVGTMDDVFERLAQAMADSRCGPGRRCAYERIEVTYDPSLGYPSSATFSFGVKRWSFRVHDVVVGDPSEPSRDAGAVDS